MFTKMNLETSLEKYGKNLRKSSETEKKSILEKLSKLDREISEELYNKFYEGFERDKENKGDIAKTMRNAGKYGRCVTGLVALVYGAKFGKDIVKKKKMTKREFIVKLGLTTALAGLTVHMHNIKNIFEKMYRKNIGKTLTEEEIEATKAQGKTGRYAHAAAITAITAGFVSDSAMSRRKFLTRTPFFIFLPAFYYLNMHKGYGALYDSAVDYTTGERKEFTNPEERKPETVKRGLKDES